MSIEERAKALKAFDGLREIARLVPAEHSWEIAKRAEAWERVAEMLAAALREREAEVEGETRKALEEIARQHLLDETDEEGDLAFAYEEMIRVARKALGR